MTSAFEMKDRMKLISLRLFGYNQKSYDNGNIFARAINMAKPEDHEALERIALLPQINIDESMALGVSHEQLLAAAQDCYKTAGVKLVQMVRDGVDLKKTPPPQQIFTYWKADKLWTQVSMQLYTSRYALNRGTVCPDMPPVYVKEQQCGAEIMPQMPSNVFLKPPEAPRTFLDFINPARWVAEMTEPLNVILAACCIIAWGYAFYYFDGLKYFLPTFAAWKSAARFQLPAVLCQREANTALGGLVSVDMVDGAGAIPNFERKPAGGGWVRETLAAAQGDWWSMFSKGKKKNNALGFDTPIELVPGRARPQVLNRPPLDPL
jgi:hypothetical protein